MAAGGSAAEVVQEEWERAAPPRPGRPPVPAYLTPVAHRISEQLAEPAFRRDPDFVRRGLPWAAAYTRWFSPRVRGVENIPETGPVLVVGNHTCLFWMPEVWVTSLALLERRGIDAPAYALAYDLLVSAPLVGPLLRRSGTLPADPEIARRALETGASVMVYPGGDHEACRPWTQRNRVDLAGHRGFVRLALETGVPVVPAVTHGGHHAVVVVARGDRLARMLGLRSLRIGVFPIVLGPLGVTTILTPPPPLPASVVVEFLPPMAWSGRRMPATERAVDLFYGQTSTLMQQTLDRLRAEEPHPLVTGARNVLRRPAPGPPPGR